MGVGRTAEGPGNGGEEERGRTVRASANAQGNRHRRGARWSAGVKLKKAGIERFRIYERSTSVGGTWWDNRYPGCQVDVGSYLYSYSFKQRYPWTRSHAKQPELLRYIEEVVEEYGLREHIQLETAVEGATWDE